MLIQSNELNEIILEKISSEKIQCLLGKIFNLCCCSMILLICEQLSCVCDNVCVFFCYELSLFENIIIYN